MPSERAAESASTSGRGGDRILEALSLALILLLSLWVRLQLSRDWLDYDECQHFLVARSPFPTDFVREFAMRAHPPLVYLMMKLPLAFGSSVHWVRGISLASGLFGVAISYWILRRLLASRWSIHLGTLAIGLAPVFVVQSITARQYALCLVFVWLGWLQYFRMRERGFERPRDHWILAALGLAALASEYSAIFHVLSLGALVYAPLVVRLVRRRSRSTLRVVALLLPGIAVLVLAALFFQWHFGGQVPNYVYTRPYLYDGSLWDLGALSDFAVRRGRAWLWGVLPPPWGAGVLLLVLLGLFLPPRTSSARASAIRAAAAAALIGSAGIFLASLFHLFPFGGLPRHAAVIQPAIWLAAWGSAVGWIERFARPGWPRVLVGTAALAALLVGLAVGIQRGAQRPFEAYAEYARRGDVERVRRARGPLVTNWRGRALASWWYTPEGDAGLSGSGDRHFIYDHGGVRVAQTDHLPTILSTARDYALRDGEAWVLLANPPDFDAGLDESFAALERALAKDEEVRVTLARRNEFVLPTILMKLERTAR